MCGIVGGFDPIHKNSDINSALKSIHARGPDQTQVCKIDSSRFLAFNLLGINSKNPAELMQPFQNERRTLTVCVNGEIYNYQPLRQDLEKKGYVFKTESDCEVVLHGLDCSGTDFLTQLNGEFALVAYFHEDKKWICAVDHVGTKPLKYHVDKQRFLVASSAEALKYLGVSLDFELDACLFSFHTACLPRGKTLFSNVRTIPPGYYLVVDEQLNHNIFAYAKDSNEAYLEQSLEEIILDSVVSRVPRHFRLALSLSGGLDSSILALLLRRLDVDFDCFSVDFEGTEFSERKEVETFCKRHGIKTEFIPILQQDLIREFSKSVKNAENLVINPHSAGKLILNQKIAESGFRVCFTGDGADEFFWGYEHFHQNDGFQFMRDSVLIGSRYTQILEPRWHTKLLESNLLLDYKSANPNPTEQVLYNNYWLNEYGLKILGDSQAATQSLEYRYPFVDRRILRKVQSTQMTRRDNAPSKNILRKIFEVYDPSMVQMPKRPFAAPFITSDWLPLFEEFVFSDRFKHLGLFQFDKLKEYVLRLRFHHLADMPKASSVLLAQILSLGVLNHEFSTGRDAKL